MKITGGCHCGQIKFRAEVNPDHVAICHCEDCQTLSGSAYRTIVPALEGTFEILSGELKQYEKTAESGSTRIQAFCPECGTPIYSGPPPGESRYLGIRVGSIHQREQLAPKGQYWFRSSLHWTQDLSQLPRVDRQSRIQNAIDNN